MSLRRKYNRIIQRKMKKLFLLAALCLSGLLASVTAFAQAEGGEAADSAYVENEDSIYRSRLEELLKKDEERRIRKLKFVDDYGGWYFGAEYGFSLLYPKLDVTNGHAFELTFGYRFSENYYLGGATGINMVYSRYHYTEPYRDPQPVLLSIENYKWSVPIWIQNRFYFTPGKVTPYVQIDLGAMIGLRYGVDGALRLPVGMDVRIKDRQSVSMALVPCLSLGYVSCPISAGVGIVAGYRF